MHKKSREMIIVPDETQVDLYEYRKELLTNDDRHGHVVKEFSDLYNLGLTCEVLNLEKENYNGYNWSLAIAKLGHLGIQKDDNIVFYIPDIITDSQYQYLKSHKKEYSIYRNNISIVNVKIEDNKFLIDEIDQFQISDDEKMIDILYDLIDDKYRMENQIKINY